jgi:autotransporter adhesin
MRYDLKKTHVAANIQRGFAGRRKIGGGLSWSVRRRIMQALRASVRVLGMRRKHRGLGPVHPGASTSRSIVGAAMVSAALALASPALATVVTETTATDAGTRGSTCSVASSAPTAASRWTCEIPNGSGGFATISGVPSTSTGEPDLVWLSNWVSTNLPGANAIILGTATTRASGANAIAIGNDASAVGLDSVAVGADASANGNEALAFGGGAEANGIHSVAIGSQAQALNTNAIAIGRESDALGEYAIGIGSGAQATGNLGTAVGNNALARQGDTALGAGALGGSASSGSTVAVGYGAGQGGGDVSRSTFVGAFAGASSQGTQNSFSGYFGGAAAVGNNNVAHGVAAGAAVTGDNNVSIGNQAGTQAQIDSNGNPVATLGSAYNRAVNIGQDTRGLADDAVAIGTAAAAAERAVAVGINARASFMNATALGQNSLASAVQSIAIGSATASNENAIAIGKGASAAGFDGVAVGTDASSGTTGYNVAIGANGTFADGSSANEGAVAIGTSQGASGDGAVAIGAGNISQGNGSVAIGRASAATGPGSLALGDSVTGTGFRAVALGSAASATSDSSVAIGDSATASSNGSAIAIGRIANASGGSAIAMGDSASASADGTLAFGAGAQSHGVDSIAIGTSSSVTGDQSIAIGVGHTIAGNRSGAFGDPTNIDGDDSYAIGNNNVIEADKAFVLGNNVTIVAGVDRAVALGHGSNVTVADGVALGAGSTADTVVGTTSATINGTTYNFAGAVPLSTVSVGSAGNERTITNLAAGRISATSTDAINGSQLFAVSQAVAAGKTHYVSINDAGQILGSGNYDNDGATGLGAIAIGTNTTAQGPLSVSLGFQARSVGRESISLGWNATSAGSSEIHIGTESGFGGVSTNITNIGIGIRTGQYVRGTSNTAMGWQAGNQVTGDLNVALGRQSGINVTGSFNTALGAYTGQNVTGASNIALGNQAGNGITASDTVSIGSDAVAGAQNGDVALGRGSITAAVAGTASSVNNGIIYNYAGIAPTSTVSIGNLGAERTITNVAAGRVSSTSTDAINGSQLYATNTAVGNLAQSVAAGMSSGSYVNPDGSVTTVLNVGGITYNNVQDALSRLNATAGAGWNISAQGANATNVADGSATGSTVDFKSSDGNVVVSKDTASNDIDFALADDITVDSVTAGNTTVDTNGVSIAGGPNGTVSLTGSGLDNGGNRITNVGAGIAATDAVNVSQLNAALGSVNIGFAGNLGANITRSSGQVLAIQGGGTTVGSYAGGNIRTVTDPGSGAINIEMAEAPKFGTVTVNDGGTGKITGVTAATLSSTSTEAVNGSQLVALGDSIAASLSPGSTYNPATNSITAQIVVGNNVYSNVQDALQAITVNGGGGGWTLASGANGSGVVTGDASASIAPGATATFVAGNNMTINQSGGALELALNPNLTGIQSIAITGGPTINGNGIDMGGDRITNVDAGVAPTDAVNLGQMNAGLANTLGQANRYTDTAIADIRFDLTRYRRDANGGTAAAMAMGQVPQAFEPGMGIAGIGMSTWQGEQAIAFGFSKASDNGRVVVRATGSYNSRSEGGAAVGVGFQF